MYRIATSTTQNREPQLPHASRNTNPHVSTSTGVNHSTSVSRPPLKSYQVKDKVVPNNSQVKFTKKEVEDHHRISSISKKTKSVTACNDSSNSRTLNVNAVCVECGKCVFNSNHDACVSKYLNDVNARTKKPKVVPISASLVLHQMTSDHNRSELEIHDHNNESSSSKLVPKVVPPADKKATSRQELELLFHHHIAMLKTTHPSDTYVFTMKMEILLEPASNKLLVGTSGGDVVSLPAYDRLLFNDREIEVNILSPMSINHEKYTLVIIDEYSRYTWVHFLRKKSQEPEMIMSFIRMVENQNDIKVKQIKTNNRTEFRNHELESFCNKKGISHNFSSPYTPKQNSVAKRKNKTLIEAAKTILNGSVPFKHF
ncbi:retrovirus-related pol polyprotein from transposon TNT 1-94 [Tanacetum coccineum]